ncbi:MAG: aspartate/glutamate racemase family protein [Anaerolineae bacterium]|nr:aspartate/glutamate racemase family protein [Anaerolineae bacterium]
MPTVVAIYTGQGLAEPLQKVFKELIPDCRLINIIDDSLINDVVSAGNVTPAVARRLIQYYQTGMEIGADVILNTCSSVSEVVDVAQNLFDIPIIKIDELMAQEAVKNYQTIGVIATLPTTLAPTVRLIQSQATRLGKQVSIVEGLAEGAYHALVNGKPEEHDQRILDTAQRLAQEVDVLVLAQGSMARMEKALHEVTGKPVLSSPSRGVTAVKSALEAKKI